MRRGLAKQNSASYLPLSRTTRSSYSAQRRSHEHLNWCVLCLITTDFTWHWQKPSKFCQKVGCGAAACTLVFQLRDHLERAQEHKAAKPSFCLDRGSLFQIASVSARAFAARQRPRQHQAMLHASTTFPRNSGNQDLFMPQEINRCTCGQPD